MVRSHQPGQAVFRSVLPEDIDWKPFAAFPPSVRLAILIGHPSERGPYRIGFKLPFGVNLCRLDTRCTNLHSHVCVFTSV